MYVGNIFKLWTFTLGHTIPDISPFLKDVLLDMPLIHVGKIYFFILKSLCESSCFSDLNSTNNSDAICMLTQIN